MSLSFKVEEQAKGYISPDEQPSNTEHNDDDSKDSMKCSPWLVQPPGLKKVCSQLGKFSGRWEEDDFSQ